ncbi:hypothetical protein D3C72_2191470 [compost metagenome]
MQRPGQLQLGYRIVWLCGHHTLPGHDRPAVLVCGKGGTAHGLVKYRVTSSVGLLRVQQLKSPQGVALLHQGLRLVHQIVGMAERPRHHTQQRHQ